MPRSRHPVPPPGGAFPFFQMPASEAEGCSIDLEDLWHSDVRAKYASSFSPRLVLRYACFGYLNAACCNNSPARSNSIPLSLLPYANFNYLLTTAELPSLPVRSDSAHAASLNCFAGRSA